MSRDVFLFFEGERGSTIRFFVMTETEFRSGDASDCSSDDGEQYNAPLWKEQAIFNHFAGNPTWFPMGMVTISAHDKFIVCSSPTLQRAADPYVFATHDADRFVKIRCCEPGKFAPDGPLDWTGKTRYDWISEHWAYPGDAVLCDPKLAAEETVGENGVHRIAIEPEMFA